MPKDDGLDLAVEDVGQRPGRGADRPPPSSGGRASVEERRPGFAPGHPVRTAPAPGRLRPARPDVAERPEALGHGPGQDDRQLRPTRGRAAATAPPARGAWTAHRPRADRPPRPGPRRHRRPSSSRVIASGSVVSTLRPVARQPLRCGDRHEFGQARAPSPPRRPSRRGRWLVTSRRGRCAAAAAPTSPIAIAVTGPASATMSRDRRSADGPLDSAAAGTARLPSSRHAPPTRPIERDRVVAEPRSMARKARGSAVTAACYPGRRPGGHDRVQASQADSSSISSSRAMSSSIPASSASSSFARGELAPEHAAQDRVEEEHRVRAERPIRATGLEEVHRRGGQAAQLDLAGDLLDELVALLLGRLVRQAHRGTTGRAAGGRAARRMATPNAWYAAAPRRAKMTCSMVGELLELVADGLDRDPGRLLEREAADARARAPGTPRSSRRSRGPGPSRCGRRASMTGPLVRRSRSSETAWMTARAARFRPASRWPRRAGPAPGGRPRTRWRHRRRA